LPTLPDVIIGRWETREVFINGRGVSPAGFVRDLKATELEPGDNQDIIKECRWVRRFAWGDTSRSTYCLALACCFYLKLSWVMDRFFLPELQHLRQANFRLAYDDETLQTAYDHCEEMFAREFTEFMDKLRAIPVSRKVLSEVESDDEL
jgi:hypothetical protein